MGAGSIKIEGLRELQAAIRRGTNQDLPKRMGQAHKEIGELVIGRLSPRPDPAAVGVGSGAAVRPSASRREVLLRVGGAHRSEASPRMQWGKRPGRRPGQPAPARPYILRTVQSNEREIYDAWLRAVTRALDPAFWKTEP